MRKRLAAAMAAFWLIAPLFAAQPQPAEPLEELESVLVIGEQPGPGLWKVSKGDHVMWVLAVYGPLPKGMTWRSQQIEARIAESQEVLYPGTVNVHPDIGVLRGLTMLRSALKAAKNPDGATLKQVLPPELYARWLVLREKYFGRDDDVEEWRPEVALGQLRDKALEKNGLHDGPDVADVVRRAGKKHKVRFHRLPEQERAVKVENPRGMVKNAGKQWTSDFACFSRDLEQLEPGIERDKLRANAWARGDIAKFRELFRVQKLQDECAYALIAGMGQGDSRDAANTRRLLTDLMWHVEQATVQSQRDWVAAAQVALEKNRSTFTVLLPNDIFRADGHLETLRKLGYTVEEPL